MTWSNDLLWLQSTDLSVMVKVGLVSEAARLTSDQYPGLRSQSEVTPEHQHIPASGVAHDSLAVTSRT